MNEEVIVSTDGLSERDIAMTKGRLAETTGKLTDGVDFSKIQISEILDAIRKGLKIEFETYSPYLSDHNTVTGKMLSDHKTPDEIIGLAIGGWFRNYFEAMNANFSVVSLFDEYNSDMADTSDARGIPFKGLGKQVEYSEEARETFRQETEREMRMAGMIKDGDVENKDYFLISETSSQETAAMLVDRLDAVGTIKRDGEKITFVNPDPSAEFCEITLRTAGGRWLCEALDASAFLDPTNLEITHIVVLPETFRSQQDKVWAILRVLGIQPTNYHNIYFDKNKKSEDIVFTVAA